MPGDPTAVEAWMVRILVNLSRDLYKWREVRRAHASTVEAMTTHQAAPGNPESQALARITVARALQSLSARRRAVLVLHDLEGMGQDRIGELLGIRAATLRWHLAAARREMKAVISGEER